MPDSLSVAVYSTVTVTPAGNWPIRTSTMSFTEWLTAVGKGAKPLKDTVTPASFRSRSAAGS